MDTTPALLSQIRHDAAHGDPLGTAVTRAREHLLSLQKSDGHWVGELQGDTILESEYILLLAFMGMEQTPVVQQAARYLLEQQAPDGDWGNYPGGPTCVSTTVKAYFALKLAGHDAEAPPLARARARIRALGGAEQCNSFTKFYLALLGQIPYDACPAVPPEMILLPTWAYFNIYAMSSWTRTIVIPLTLFYAHKPRRSLPVALGIRELFLGDPADLAAPPALQGRVLTWPNCFRMIDRLLKYFDPQQRTYPPVARSWWRHALAWLRQPLTELRRAAVARSAQWLFEHFADSDGVGAIFPPMIYTVISLRCLGYADDSPEMIWALKQLSDLIIEENGSVRLQPCVSPVWDTAIALNALAATPEGPKLPEVRRAAHWLLAREVRRPGDWMNLVKGVEAGGWFFEYRNGYYPDTDDTAMVLMGLARNGQALVEPGKPARSFQEQPDAYLPEVHRALRWLLAMQNSDGGWAAFDRDINREVLTKVPFADHNAMLDPSCPDITARVLEALGEFGHHASMPAVAKALAFIARTQDRRGCWIGRWGVNYIYGTWQVLVGLQVIGCDMSQPMVRRAVAWLQQVQQADGGWGETCRSYDDPELAGQGPPTASQTAWALLGLLAAGEGESTAVKAGMDYLIRTQRADGNWDEPWFTGTGFPKVFYLKYHLYRLYFPLMALARYRKIAPAPEQALPLGEPHSLGERSAPAKRPGAARCR